jgi:uncharacterized membrane protein YuzA (DUF378 family)
MLKKMEGPYMKNQKIVDYVTVVLLLLGGLCWGLVGAFGFDLIGALFNTESDMMSPLTRIIYVLIGLATVYRIFVWAKRKK